MPQLVTYLNAILQLIFYSKNLDQIDFIKYIHKRNVFLVNCKWSGWSKCASTSQPITSCGEGVKTRTHAIQALYGGQPCEGAETEACNLGPCSKIISDYILSR